jgi:hypothetical protein
MGHPKDKERGITQQHRGLSNPTERSRIPELNIGFPEAIVPLLKHKSKHPLHARDINERAAEDEVFEHSLFLLDQTRGKGDRGAHQRGLLLLADSLAKGASSANALSQNLIIHIQTNKSPRLFNEKDAEMLIRSAFEKFKKIHKILDRDFVWIWTFGLLEEYKKEVINSRQERISDRVTEIENDALLLNRIVWSNHVLRLAKEANISYEFAELLLIEYESLQEPSIPVSRTQVIEPRFYHGIQGAVSGGRNLFSTTTGITVSLPLAAVGLPLAANILPYFLAHPWHVLIGLSVLMDAEAVVSSLTGKSVLSGGRLETWERVLGIVLIVIPHFKYGSIPKYAGAGILIGITLSRKAATSAKLIAKLAIDSGEDLALVIKKAKRLGSISGQQADRLWKAARASIAKKKPLKITQLERAFVKELDDAVRQFKGKKPSLKTPHKATKKPSQRNQDDISLDRAFREDANFDHGSFLAKGRMKRPKSDEQIPSFDLLPLTSAQKAGVKRISGKRLSIGFQGAWQRIINNNLRAKREILEIQRLFNSGQVEAAKKLGRDAYIRARRRFWRYIKEAKDEEARALKSQLEKAGLRFSGSNGTAPYWQFPDGFKEILTLEHAIRVTDAPWRAVAANNFQFVPFRENVNTLEWIRGLPEFK